MTLRDTIKVDKKKGGRESLLFKRGSKLVSSNYLNQDIGANESEELKSETEEASSTETTSDEGVEGTRGTFLFKHVLIYK